MGPGSRAAAGGSVGYFVVAAYNVLRMAWLSLAAAG